ncbi:hypothetical protein BJY01DRAFT_81108 [Aspergillus pseudoustus]|uniref:Uncharacterized protein n=1 Tax=Aspergillus pseudoustus TaxID=1810923 RepID=A0ABR4J6F9_9EURO
MRFPFTAFIAPLTLSTLGFGQAVLPQGPGRVFLYNDPWEWQHAAHCSDLTPFGCLYDYANWVEGIEDCAGFISDGNGNLTTLNGSPSTRLIVEQQADNYILRYETHEDHIVERNGQWVYIGDNDALFPPEFLVLQLSPDPMDRAGPLWYSDDDLGQLATVEGANGHFLGERFGFCWNADS